MRPDTGADTGRGLGVLIAAAVLGVAFPHRARAGGNEATPAPLARPVLYIGSGSEFSYVARTAALPAARLGVAALASADWVRDTPVRSGLGSEDVSTPQVASIEPSSLLHPAGSPQLAALAVGNWQASRRRRWTMNEVIGTAAGEPAPGDWPRRVGRSGAQIGATPMAAQDGRGSERGCRCATLLGDTSRERVAVLYASREFVVGKELSAIRMLRARVRYQDGLVAYVNGQEVARRNVARGASGFELAERARGREWESFYIPAVPGLLRPGKNTLAVEVRPSGRRLAPYLDVELTAATHTRIVRGPIVQRVDQTSAVIVFDTDLPARGAVEYGPTPERGIEAVSAGGSLAVHHVVSLTGLRRASAVYYRVAAGGDITQEFVFHTAPTSDEPIRFVVYGDMRDGHDVHRQIVETLLGEAVDFVLVTGDLVRRGSDEGDWERFFAVSRQLVARVPIYPVAGNHDAGQSGDERRRMGEIFSLWPGPVERPSWGHWYSFDVADLHFVMLDSNAYDRPEQLAWLREDLQAAQVAQRRAVFVVVHDGPYSRGLHRGNRYAAEHYAPVFVQGGVTVLFSGHDHLYQRGRILGLDYIVTGGAGAPLYPVRCGLRRLPRCRVADGLQTVAVEHHYVLVTAYRDYAIVCPKRADGSALEPCIRYPLGAASQTARQVGRWRRTGPAPMGRMRH